MRNEEFEKYIRQLSRTDHLIWKLIKNSKKPEFPASPIRESIYDPWAKSDSEKAQLFAKCFECVFQPFDNAPSQEIEKIKTNRIFATNKMYQIRRSLSSNPNPQP